MESDLPLAPPAPSSKHHPRAIHAPFSLSNFVASVTLAVSHAPSPSPSRSGKVTCSEVTPGLVSVPTLPSLKPRTPFIRPQTPTLNSNGRYDYDTHTVVLKELPHHREH